MSRAFDKSEPVHNRELVRQYAQEHESCACCWKHERGAWPPHAVHHLSNGKFGRSDEWANLIRLCDRCHRLAEMENVRDDRTRKLYPKLTLAHVLWLKRECDAEHFDLVRLEQLFHRSLPEPEQVPAIFLSERRERGLGRYLPWEVSP